MSECAVTVLSDVRARRSVDLSAAQVCDAMVITRGFPQSATDDHRSVSDLVRAAAVHDRDAVAIECGSRVLTVGDIAASMDTFADTLGTFLVDADSALTMALMMEIPELCDSGADGLESALVQLRDRVAFAS